MAVGRQWQNPQALRTQDLAPARRDFVVPSRARMVSLLAMELARQNQEYVQRPQGPLRVLLRWFFQPPSK